MYFSYLCCKRLHWPWSPVLLYITIYWRFLVYLIVSWMLFEDIILGNEVGVSYSKRALCEREGERWIIYARLNVLSKGNVLIHPPYFRSWFAILCALTELDFRLNQLKNGNVLPANGEENRKLNKIIKTKQ